MSQYQLLKEQLQEMFQLDRGDLDFGIYRIMNQKREEVTDFLDKQLLPQVREILEQANPDNNAQVQTELDGVMKTLLDLGADTETNPKVRELRGKLGASVDLSKMENEIYSDLLNFFKRYYSDGDFMSMRRYKEGVYAMPYEGEEVKLHWANHDQYYIKTSESLKNYTFKSGKKKIRFELADASTEKNNNKAAEGNERRFILHEENPILVAGDEMVIQFEFRPDTDKRKQEKINEETFALLKDRAEINGFELLNLAPTEKKKERTLLEKHLTDFTAKNSFDYFIHKDLGKFLSRELDFYIKNEIMHLDDIENETVPKIESYLSKIKALRKVAGKIITFLAQLEDFQKKLWLKKKFILESHYCVTIDHIVQHEDAEALLKIIESNNAQREEWLSLFAIDEVDGYSSPLTTDFLKANDKLLIDTKFYDTKFKYQLIGGFDKLDAQSDGLMINSENFQALNLLQERYQHQIDSAQIDPPYNTGDDGFCYKDSYKSSSWLSCLSQSVRQSKKLLQETGSFYAFCDENQFSDFGLLLRDIFGNENHVETITWNKRIPKNDKGVGNIHDTIYLFSKNERERRENDLSFIMRKESLDEIYDIVRKLKSKKSTLEVAKKELKKFYKKEGFDRGITLYCELDPNYDIWGKINMSWPNPKTEGPRYDVMNPVTGAICPVPDRGWRWTEETFKEKLTEGEAYSLPDGSRVVGRIWFSTKSSVQPSSITYLKEVESFLLRSILSFKSDGGITLRNIGLEGLVDYPKPLRLMETLAYSVNNTSAHYLDFFAGSGTTGHAVINLNRDDQGHRKYSLVEMGSYFHKATKPRIQKASYSSDWKDGKPSARDGISHLMKYLTLEQYEDTLDNLNLERNETQSSLLAQNPTLKEEYLLSYMLDTESRGSQSLLNIDGFVNPFDYQLRITRDDDTQLVKVDLVETFNYLLGLIVDTMQLESNGIISVTGKTNREGKRCLILWRNLSEVNNEQLDDWFKKRYSARDFEFDSIYINGDNHIENLKLDDDHWKVQLIESEFQKLMFSSQDV